MMNKGKVVDVVHMGFYKAFDKVQRGGLFKKSDHL